jgi:hypothetical protein
MSVILQQQDVALVTRAQGAAACVSINGQVVGREAHFHFHHQPLADSVMYRANT